MQWQEVQHFIHTCTHNYCYWSCFLPYCSYATWKYGLVYESFVISHKLNIALKQMWWIHVVHYNMPDLLKSITWIKAIIIVFAIKHKSAETKILSWHTVNLPKLNICLHLKRVNANKNNYFRPSNLAVQCQIIIQQQ